MRNTISTTHFHTTYTTLKFSLPRTQNYSGLSNCMKSRSHQLIIIHTVHTLWSLICNIICIIYSDYELLLLLFHIILFDNTDFYFYVFPTTYHLKLCARAHAYTHERGTGSDHLQPCVNCITLADQSHQLCPLLDVPWQSRSVCLCLCSVMFAVIVAMNLSAFSTLSVTIVVV